MKKKDLIIVVSCFILLLMVVAYIISSYRWMQGVISDNNDSLDGSFVIMMLDANNKPTKYWVLQNETVDMSKGLISFDEKDGQTIHLHGNVILKEFDDDIQLETIKKEYGLK